LIALPRLGRFKTNHTVSGTEMLSAVFVVSNRQSTSSAVTCGKVEEAFCICEELVIKKKQFGFAPAAQMTFR
jgi:cAMP phosphodiesterase